MINGILAVDSGGLSNAASNCQYPKLTDTKHLDNTIDMLNDGAPNPGIRFWERLHSNLGALKGDSEYSLISQGERSAEEAKNVCVYI